MTQIKVCVTWALPVFSESSIDSGYIRVMLPFEIVFLIQDHEVWAYKWMIKILEEKIRKLQLLPISPGFLTHCSLFTS